MRAFILAVVLAQAPVTVHAQSLRDLPRGAVVERLTSAYDTAQRYAVYLPASYDTARAWPLAVLMDPRGRALVPMSLAREAAERHGYVVISSYNTVSDSTVQPNVDAVNAMIQDTRLALRIDPSRIYLVGFSGTARLAWHLAEAAPGVAGILGAGASGLAFSQARPGRMRPVAYYGIVGLTDFNHDEQVAFEPWLERNGMARRLRVFGGGHAWPPAPAFMEAFGWFRLRSLRATALSAADSALVADLLAGDRAAADSLEAAGAWAEAADRVREIVQDYGELADVAAEAARLALLEEDRRVMAARERRAADLRAVIELSERLVAWRAVMLDVHARPRADDGLRRLRVSDLQRTARDRDVARAAAAERRLQSVFTNLSFYLPRELLAAGLPERALLSLDMAERAVPGTARVSLLRAHALLAQGRGDDAVAALGEAVRRGASLDAVAADPAFTSLHGHRDWPVRREADGAAPCATGA